MKLATALWLAMWLTPAAGQNSAIDPTSQVMTFSYPMQSGFATDLLPTTLLPQAKGAVSVVRGSIAIDIDVRVDNIPPAQNLGGGFNTYVVWLISPDGEISNIGELLLNGNSGMLQTTTNWGAFGVFVTAETNNCVSCPSRSVVLVNDVCMDGLPPERLVTIACRTSTPCSNDRTPPTYETR
jgi:hypothetical protein